VTTRERDTALKVETFVEKLKEKSQQKIRPPWKVNNTN